MHLTRYLIVPAKGGWSVVSTFGRTRFDGKVFAWAKACEIKARLDARQARIYARRPEPIGLGRQLEA